MVKRQGNKYYLQLLLDPGKYQLLETQATQRKVKVTSLARDAIYHWLSQNVDPDLFDAANTFDAAVWKQSVDNRVRGRKRSKEMRDGECREDNGLPS